MKKIQILITIAFVISIISSSVYATEPKIGTEQNGTENNGKVEQKTKIFKEQDSNEKHRKDPLERLEERKENIQKEYKEGKITKEKADELTKKIDKHITKIKEFNSLTLPQKKEHLLDKVKSRIELEVKAGKLTKEEGEKKLKEFSKELENWNGKQFPRSMKRCEKCKSKN